MTPQLQAFRDFFHPRHRSPFVLFNTRDEIYNVFGNILFCFIFELRETRDSAKFLTAQTDTISVDA